MLDRSTVDWNSRQYLSRVKQKGTTPSTYFRATGKAVVQQTWDARLQAGKRGLPVRVAQNVPRRNLLELRDRELGMGEAPSSPLCVARVSQHLHQRRLLFLSPSHDSNRRVAWEQQGATYGSVKSSNQITAIVFRQITPCQLPAIKLYQIS
jgi:hypothetical protein